MVAAGKSKRLKSRVPKPFLQIDRNRTMLDMCLESFRKVPGLAHTVIVTQKGLLERAAQALCRCQLTGSVTEGGPEREDSVFNGLETLPPKVKYVLIHDAARPLVDPALIRRVLKEVFRSGAAIPVVPVKDTLKVIGHGRVLWTLDRSRVGAVQTPQGFKLSNLRTAFLKLGPRASRLTDDAAIAELAGMKVRVVDGNPLNLKVTTPEDLRHVRHLVAHD